MLFCIYCTLHYDIVYSMGLFALQKKMAEYSQKEKGIKSQKKKYLQNKAVILSFSSSSSLFSASNVSDSIHQKSWLIHYYLKLYNGTK